MSVPFRDMPECPPGFADRFIRDGWRGVERVYGASTPLLLRWIEDSGGYEELKRRRREMLQTKWAGVNPVRRTA